MRNNKKKGFTLVELLVVIAILAILATVSVVGYTSYIESTQVRVDSDLATQLNHLLEAYKVNFSEPITEDNIHEVTANLLKEGGVAELNPASSKYGYHYYFNLATGKYELLHNRDAVDDDSILEHLIRFVFKASAEETSEYKITIGNCFTKGYQYFLVDTAGDLADVIEGYYSFDELDGATTADRFKTYLTKVTNAEVTPITNLVNSTVFVTNDGNYVADLSATHTNLAFVKGATFLGNVLKDTDSSTDDVILGGENYLLTLTDDKTIELPAGIKLPANSLHISVADGKKVTVVIDSNAWTTELKDIVDAYFTNDKVTVVVGGQEYKINANYIHNASSYGQSGDTYVDILKFNNPMLSFNLELQKYDDGFVKNESANVGYVVWEKDSFELDINTILGMKNDGSDVSSSEVTWSVHSDYEDYLTVEDGVFKFTTATPPDVIKVVATAKVNKAGYFTDNCPAGVANEPATQTFDIKVVRVTGINMDNINFSDYILANNRLTLVANSDGTKTITLTQKDTTVDLLTYNYDVTALGLNITDNLVLKFACSHTHTVECCSSHTHTDACKVECTHECDEECFEDCRHEHMVDEECCNHVHGEACFRGKCTHVSGGTHLDEGETVSDCLQCVHTEQQHQAYEACDHEHIASCTSACPHLADNYDHTDCCNHTDTPIGSEITIASDYLGDRGGQKYKCSLCTEDHEYCFIIFASNKPYGTNPTYKNGDLWSVNPECTHSCQNGGTPGGNKVSHTTHTAACCEHKLDGEHVDPDCYSACPHRGDSHATQVNSNGVSCNTCTHAHDDACYTCNHTHDQEACLNDCAHDTHGPSCCTHKCVDNNYECITCQHEHDEYCQCNHVCDENCETGNCPHKSITVDGMSIKADGSCIGKLVLEVEKYIKSDEITLEIFDAFAIKAREDLLYVGNGSVLKVTDLFDGEIPEDAVIQIWGSIVNSDTDTLMTPNRTLLPLKSAVDDMTFGEGEAIPCSVTDNQIGFVDGAWETIQFHNTRTETVWIAITQNGVRISEDVVVNIVDGVNVRNFSELSTSSSNVLLNDISIPKSPTAAKRFTLANGKTLYGNAFTFDITEGAEKDYYGIIELTENSTMKDLRVIAKIYPNISLSGGSQYGTNAVSAEGGVTIDNCYIANARCPLWVRGDVTINDTVLFGGRYASIDLRGGTLKLTGKVVTVNQPHNDPNDAVSIDVVGVGISVWYNPDDYSIDLSDCTSFCQYNFVSEESKDLLPDVTITIPDSVPAVAGSTVTVKLPEMFAGIFGNNKYSQYFFTKDGETLKYVNPAIVDLNFLGGGITITDTKDATTNIGKNYGNTSYSYTVLGFYPYTMDIAAPMYKDSSNNVITANKTMFTDSLTAVDKYSPWDVDASNPAYDFVDGKIIH